MPTVEVELEDGATAVWFIDPDTADAVAEILTERLGQPCSIRA